MAGGRSASDELLQRLLLATASGEGELLRLSARRLVQLVDLDGQRWLFKLDSPRRAFERLRGRLRPPSLLREANNLRELGVQHPGLPSEVHAEQLDAANGLLARPWLTGRQGESWVLDDAEPVGHGMAKLHGVGWSDPDLSAADLLLDEAGNLVPLDLGHAHLHAERVTPPKVRRRDLVRLLGGWNQARRETLGAAILETYRSVLDCPPTSEVLAAARSWRLEILRRQSRRCLRRTRDFTPTDSGVKRTEDLPEGTPWRFEVGEGVKAKDVFRLLYELELLELPAVRVLSFTDEGSDVSVEVATPSLNFATVADKQAVEDCMSAFASAGFLVEDFTYAMFHIQPDGTALLADASGLKRA